MAGKIILYILAVSTFGYSSYSLWDVSTTIPGYIQRGNLTREEYLRNDNKVKIKNEEIQLKYCETCMIIRPLRSFHCSVCDCCVKIHGKFKLIYINNIDNIDNILYY